MSPLETFSIVIFLATVGNYVGLLAGLWLLPRLYQALGFRGLLLLSGAFDASLLLLGWRLGP